jgi:hypothetical protein
LLRAFDEMRFGRTRTLDLRSSLPSAADAAARAEAWLRERQASVGGELLIITGRGRGSDDGIPVVRPAVQRRLSRLRREGVVDTVEEHSSGAFIIVLAPLRALIEAPRRRKDPVRPARQTKAAQWASGLKPQTLTALRELAVRSLDSLGAPQTDALINDEMHHHYRKLAGAIGTGVDRDARLRAAVRSALDELSDE